MNASGNSTPLPGDNPIGNHEDDVLERAGVANDFARQVLELDAGHGTTVGVFGEQAPGLSGRDYLEKIIQWSFNLPEVPSHLLARQLEQAIKRALAAIENPGWLDEEVWSKARVEIVRPLIRNMRDVRRYAIAVRSTVGGLEGQVALADVLALEAVRVFLPDVFGLLSGAIDGLTGMTQAVERRVDRMRLQVLEDPFPGLNKWLKKQVDGLSTAAGKDRAAEAARTAREVVEATVDNLFPVGAGLRSLSDGNSDPCVNHDAAKHLRARRVAHEHIFRRYLERTTSPELLAFHDAERALARMADRNRLTEFIHSLGSPRWQGVVSNLRDLADRFRPEHVEPGVVVLLDLLPDMQERPSRSSVRGSDTGGNRSASYSSAAGRLGRCGRRRSRGTSYFALLQSVRGEMRTESIGSRAVRRTAVLDWECLIDLYGGEDVLETRFNDLKARIEILKPWLETRPIPLDEAEQLLELADRYLSGWRPEAD